MSKRKKYTAGCEVSEVVKVTLGGYEQKIAIEGKFKNLPVVICLHGGPGSPVPYGVGCRGLYPYLTDNAVAVYWDQLGCGANNYKLDDNFHIENFADMTCDLIEYIRGRFPGNKLYLFGVSWGSILALQAALRKPEMLDGAFTYGQVLKNLFFNGEVASAFSAAPQKAKDEANAILRTGYGCEYRILDKNLKRLYKLLNKYTNAYNNKNAKPAPVLKIARGLLFSPDYTFKDFKAVMKNGYAENRSLWRELLSLDLTPELSRLKIKYLLLQGDTDVITSTANVLKAVENCGNENVSVKVLKNSGHLPSAAAMDECVATLLKFIR